MNIPFYKYHGTGNDFILIDNRAQKYVTEKDETLIQELCHRRYGIGADGLMLLQDKQGFDFEMVYFNSDGSLGMMCGNGGRCIVAFAKFLDIIEEECYFLGPDGPHHAHIFEDNHVRLSLRDVEKVEQRKAYFFLNTGTAHYVRFVDSLEKVDIVGEGRKIRYAEEFSPLGTNVNFVEKCATGICVATYERGVEDETLSCGTGVTATAIAHYIRKKLEGPQKVEITTQGGRLLVELEQVKGVFKNICLNGPAVQVFEGKWEDGSTKHEDGSEKSEA